MYTVFIKLPDISIIIPVLQVLIGMVFITGMIKLLEAYIPFIGN